MAHPARLGSHLGVQGTVRNGVGREEIVKPVLVRVLRQRSLALLSLGNRAGIKELPALWVGGGRTGSQLLKGEAAVLTAVSVQRVKRSRKEMERVGRQPRL